MKTRIPPQLIKDYAIMSIGYFFCLIMLNPFYFNHYAFTGSVYTQALGQAVLLFIALCVSELFPTFVLRRPLVYSDPLHQHATHYALTGVVCVPLMAWFLDIFYVVAKFGIEHIDYAWISEVDGSFTMKWWMNSVPACIMMGIFIYIFMMIRSHMHKMQLSLTELRALNEALAHEHERQEESITAEREPSLITITSECRDSLQVDPLDIIYVESIANYLNIVYLNNSDIASKRLRSSLKDIEETLSPYSFLVHTHRAFLVNIRFITQITGNSAGYKLQLFSIDKTIPVSKSNINQFKQAVNNH